MNVYNSFYEAPLDDPPEWEGDDSIPVNGRPHERFMYAKLSQPASSAIVVPFFHSEPGDQGDRVYALKRAHARYRDRGRLTALETKPIAVRRTWSKTAGAGTFTKDFKETQARLGVPVTGQYDKATHARLAPWYDAKALTLLQPDPRDRLIAKQIGWHMEFYNQRYRIAYSQARPSQLGPVAFVSRSDCSGSVAGGCNWAGILPRVDWRWTNTDVQIIFGEHVSSLAAALPGDIVFYGRDSDPSHEALYVGNGRVWSFGSYPCRLLDISYRHDRIAIRRFVP